MDAPTNPKLCREIPLSRFERAVKREDPQSWPACSFSDKLRNG
jgi:hypothetical protein